MITALTFENFRGFKKQQISPLKRINLIAGANNTGKTALLEGLCLLGLKSEDAVRQLTWTFRSRVGIANIQPQRITEDEILTFWQTLFFDSELHQRVTATCKTEQNEEFRCGLESAMDGILIRMTHDQRQESGNFVPSPRSTLPIVGGGAVAQPTGLFRTPPGLPQGIPIRDESFFIGGRTSADVTAGNFKNACPLSLMVISTRLENPIRHAELYNQISLKEGGEERVLSLMRQVDPRLTKLRYAKAPGTSQPLVYAHFGLKNAICITQTGEGFTKLFSLFCQMILAESNVLLIDEVENGLYYETLPQIWKGIAVLASEGNIQVFATTHSRECIIAAHEALNKADAYDLALHRMQIVNKNLEVITHDQAMLEAALRTGLDVR